MENKDIKEEKKDAKNPEVKKEEKKKEPSLEEINQDLMKQVTEWKNKYYQAYADCDNLRKSYEKDHQQMIKYRAMGFIDNVLPVLDSFHMVLSTKPQDPKLINYFQGFEMIEKQLLSALENEGVKEIYPKIGDEFSHETMQAVEVREADTHNKVLQVYSKGYFLKDRLVRPAMVVVSKLKEEKKDEKKSEDKPADEKVIN